MIHNRWVFKDRYHADIVHRDAELESLSRLLEPATRGQRAEDALIYGLGGVGKTATTRWLLRDLYQRANVQSTALECSNQTPTVSSTKVAGTRKPSTGLKLSRRPTRRAAPTGRRNQKTQHGIETT